jgi:hypothetical protein
VVLLCAPADAALIRYYANSLPAPDPNGTDGYLTQPGTQGWATNGNMGFFMPVNDGGMPAWGQNTRGQPTDAMYTIYPTDSDISDANALGWTIKVIARLPSTSDAASGQGATVYYADGAHAWGFDLGTDADGDPIVTLGFFGGPPSYTLQGAGNAGYHTYEMVYDTVAKNVDMFIDGNEVLSNWGGFGPYSGKRFSWGDTTSGTDGGQSLWHVVQWRSVPEPATMALIGFGAAALLARRKRRK